MAARTLFILLFAVAPMALQAEQWTPVACFPDSYDAPALGRLQGRVVFADEIDETGPWEALKGPQNAPATVSVSMGDKRSGQAALAVDYRFDDRQGIEYVSLARQCPPIEKRGCGAVLWVKGDGSKAPLRIRIADNKGETFQFELATIRFTDWRQVSVLFREPAGHWGGDNNGRIDYPCRFDSLVIDRPQRGAASQGRVLLDRFEIREEAEVKPVPIAVETLNPRLGNIYDPGETVALRAVMKETAPAGPKSLQWSLEDYWGATLASESKPVEDGGAAISWKLTPPGTGWYRCRISLVSGAKLHGGLEFRFGVAPPLAAARPRGGNAFGMNSHFSRTAWPLEAMELVARAGAGHIRDEMGWSTLEKEKGKFVFPERYGQYVNKAVSLGIEPLVILDYANRFYDNGNYPTTPEAIAGYARYASEVARRFKGRVKHYEIWNEYTGGCGMKGKPKSAPEVYARMIEPACKAIKAADPSATVVGIGGDNPRQETHVLAMTRMLEAGAIRFMDAGSIHPYRYPEAPDSSDLVSVIKKARHLFAELGGNQRLWITEVGWPTQLDPRGVTERVQAQMLVKAYILAMASDCVDKLFWYDFKDDGLKRELNEDNFGIIHHQDLGLAPKPAYIALATLIRNLTGAKFDKALELGKDARGYAFKTSEGRSLVVMWAIGKPVQVSWPGKARVADIMGGARETPEGLELTADPVFVTGLNAPPRIAVR